MSSDRTRPTPRIVLLVLLSGAIYAAGANIGAGTVLLLAAGMGVGTVWSVVGFLRRVRDLHVRVDDHVTALEGLVTLPAAVTVPRGVIGVLRPVPVLPPDVASLTLLEVGTPGQVTEQWSPLPRSGTSDRVGLTSVLARGRDQRVDLELELTDVFGLVRRRRTLAGPLVDVTPAAGAPAAFAADSVEGDEDEWIAHALAANGTPSTELRPWRPGEAVRAVHWAASERASQLLVRPRGPETQQRRTLTVEDRPWTRRALDTRCRDLTATADRLVRAGVEVEVEAGGQVLPWGHEARLLLASLAPNAASIPSPDPRGRAG